MKITVLIEMKCPPKIQSLISVYLYFSQQSIKSRANIETLSTFFSVLVVRLRTEINKIYSSSSSLLLYNKPLQNIVL